MIWEMKTMKIWRLVSVLLAALSLASCSQSPKKASGDAGQAADSAETISDSETEQVALRFVIGDKHLSRTDSVVRAKLGISSDPIVIKYSIENTTQWHYTYLSDEYWIERQVDGEWIRMPNDFGSTLMGKEIPAHSSVNDSAKVSLAAGHYRFCNTAHPDDARIDNKKIILQAEFKIE